MEHCVDFSDCIVKIKETNEQDVVVVIHTEKDLDINANHFIMVKEDINLDIEKVVYHDYKVVVLNIIIEIVYLEMEDLVIVIDAVNVPDVV